MATLIARFTRCVFSEAVYVLHAFKKKSKRGTKTPWATSN